MKMRTNVLVEFDRRPLDRFLLRGFVLEYNHYLTLIHVLNDYIWALNGYAVLANADVRKWRTVETESFIARAVAHQRLRPKAPAGVQIENWRSVCETAGKQFPLLTISRERLKRNACDIGRFIKTSQRSLIVRDLDPDVKWCGLEKYQFRDFTLMKFGGAYESLLAALAPPARS
jgi:hypothetical protein